MTSSGQADLTERRRDEVVGGLRYFDEHLVPRHGEGLGEGAVTRDAEAAPGGPDAGAGREARRLRDAADALDSGNVRQQQAAAGNRPDAIARSAGLSAAASSSTTACPSAGCGSGCSPSSGGASYVETSAARNGLFPPEK